MSEKPAPGNGVAVTNNAKGQTRLVKGSGRRLLDSNSNGHAVTNVDHTTRGGGRG